MPEHILIDDPAPHVRRITLNRPEKRNALNQTIRREVIETLRANDADPEVRVSIVRGAGVCFSAGYDLVNNMEDDQPPPEWTSAGLGDYPRHVTEGWMSLWDLAKPVIAQVHGYCLAGGTELATGCDLVYVSEDAQIGYPAVRFGTPDMQYHAWLMGMRLGMEQMLTGNAMTGTEAAQCGFATRAFPAEELEERVLDIARQITNIPPDVVQVNKRTVHRAMDNMGMRASIRQGTELCTVAMFTEGFQAFMRDRAEGLTTALSKRDAPFGDYRTRD